MAIWRPRPTRPPYQPQPLRRRVPTTPAAAVFTLITSSSAGALSAGPTATTGGVTTTGADLIILSVGWGTTGVPTVSDSNGNTWTGLTQQTSSGGARNRLYYCQAPSVGAGHTFTATLSGGLVNILMLAFSGSASSPLDVQAGSNGAANQTLSTGNISPTQDGDLVITGLSNDGQFDLPITVVTGYSTPIQVSYSGGNHFGGCIAYKVQTTATTTDATWDVGYPIDLAVTIASFKAGVAGPGFRNLTGSTSGVAATSATFSRAAWAYRAGSYANNGAAVTIVQSTSTTITLGAAVSAGDMLLLHAIALNTQPGGATPTFTVSDSVNGTWGTADDTVTQSIVSLNERQSVYSFPNSGAGTPVITVTPSSGSADFINVGLQCAAFSGIVTTTPKDVAVHATGTSATPSSGATSATAAANELVIGCYGDYGENQTITEGAGYTLAGKHQSDGGRYQALLEYKDSGLSGSTPSAGVTLPATNTGWAMFAVVYKIPRAAVDLTGTSAGVATTSATPSGIGSFGYNTIGAAGTDNTFSGWIWCKASSTPSFDGTLTSISAYCQRWNSGDAGATVAMALYSDNAGQPGTLIVANETGVAVGASLGWVSQSFSQAITAGTQYWFGIKGDAYGGSFLNDIRVTFDTNGSLTELFYITPGGDANPGNFPSSTGGTFTGSVPNERWSIYATYTPSGNYRNLTATAAGVATASATVTTVSLPYHFYTTTFPATENPMLQGGIWKQGATDGIDWQNMRTTTNKAFGTQSGNSGQYDDSCAVLKGTFGPDQRVQATVVNAQAGGDYYGEIELLLRATIAPNSIHLYEVVLNINSTWNYIGVAKWQGARGSFTDLTPGLTGPVVHTGDVIVATMIGNTIRLYINGSFIFSVTDSIGLSGTAPYTTGNPGVGHWVHNLTQSPTGSNYGWSAYTAQSILLATSGGGSTASGIIQRKRPLTGTSAGVATTSANIGLPQHYYSTVFPATENPMLQGNVWRQGAVDGLDWSNTRTTTNKVFGTQTGNNTGTTTVPSKYDDSVSVLRGTFTANQYVKAVAFNTVVGGDFSTEVELLLRWTITPHSTTGYEVEFSTNPSFQYFDIVKWQGAVGVYTPLIHLTGFYVHNGDVVSASIFNNTITAYINGVQVGQVTDSIGLSGTAPFTTGNPGIGHYLNNRSQSGDVTTYGWTSYSAQSAWLVSAAGFATANGVVQRRSATLFATAAGVGAANATIQRKRVLTASTAGIGASNAAIQRKKALSTLSVGTTVTGATVTRLRNFTASSAGVAIDTATIQRKRALTATSAGIGISSATVKARRSLTAASAGIATDSAVLSARRTLTATSVGHATTTASVASRATLFASSAGVASVSTVVSARRVLVATTIGLSSSSATIGRKRTLTAASDGIGAPSATIGRRRALTAAPISFGTATAVITRLRALTAASAGITTASATVARSRTLTATSAGIAVSSAVASARRSLSASTAGTSVSNAIVSARRTLIASAAGGSTTSGVVVGRPSLFTSITGTAVTSAVLSARRSLVAASAGIALSNATVTRRIALTAVSAGVATTTGAPSRFQEFTALASGSTTTLATITRLAGGALNTAGISTVFVTVSAKRALVALALSATVTTGFITGGTPEVFAPTTARYHASEVASAVYHANEILASKYQADDTNATN